MGNAHRDAILCRQLEGRQVVEHALVIPDDVILPGMLLKKGAHGPVILHRILAAAGNHPGFADLPALVGIGRILITGQKIKADAAPVDPPAIGHQEVFHAALAGRHAHRQHADGLAALWIHTAYLPADVPYSDTPPVLSYHFCSPNARSAPPFGGAPGYALLTGIRSVSSARRRAQRSTPSGAKTG